MPKTIRCGYFLNHGFISLKKKQKQTRHFPIISSWWLNQPLWKKNKMGSSSPNVGGCHGYPTMPKEGFHPPSSMTDRPSSMTNLKRCRKDGRRFNIEDTSGSCPWLILEYIQQKYQKTKTNTRMNTMCFNVFKFWWNPYQHLPIPPDLPGEAEALPPWRRPAEKG